MRHAINRPVLAQLGAVYCARRSPRTYGECAIDKRIVSARVPTNYPPRATGIVFLVLQAPDGSPSPASVQTQEPTIHALRNMASPGQLAGVATDEQGSSKRPRVSDRKCF